MIATLADLGYFIFGLYSLLLILSGTPLNLLCFYIFKRVIPNRSNATIIVFSYLAIIELLIPFTWNLNYTIRELVWKRQTNSTIKNLEEHSLFVCKLVSFSAYFLLQCAAWLKTLATFARCVSVHNEWTIRKYILNSRAIHRLCWMTIILIGIMNFPIWIVNGKEAFSIDKNNKTQKQIMCYRSVFFKYWEIVHLLLYNFIPFTFMILCNIAIIRHVRESRRRTQRSKMRSASIVKSPSTLSSNRRSLATSDGRLTKTLIFITIFFIICTSPSAIFYISLGKIIKRHRHLITMGLSNLATTSHVSSFIIYWLTSSDFKNAVISFLYCRAPVSQGPSAEDKLQHSRYSTRAVSTSMRPSSSDLQRKLPTLYLSPSID
ncbi:unnamed protein product [Adineta steineri]|uniref:G-protein coupled receptors family 1 profile domain-containing protein n=1 Tax=Adineta steineri TaxID=433720 RepID=A0A815CNK1_9BILA|nr:unnamed protein product [Adineta steineri]CAF1310504.1 unnamed protein product [Adineta steineri]CAF3488224.1 unnamed protein product [Adineta steineri]CAF3817909.1 unnamed protein product [Adineta steineri]